MKYLQRRNDAVREEERDLAAEDVESIPSDHNSDSESSGTTSKPASTSSKETREQNETAEEGLKYLQRRNDAVREKERDLSAEDLE